MLMHGLDDLGRRDRPGMRETLQQRSEAEKMIAMCVGDVNCGEVLAARDDPILQSLRLLDCEKSVHEDSVPLAVDERRRICHPHQLFLAGWQITSEARAPYGEHIPAQAGVSGFNCHHCLHLHLRKTPGARFGPGESAVERNASQALPTSGPTRCSQNHTVAAASACGNCSRLGSKCPPGISTS